MTCESNHKGAKTMHGAVHVALMSGRSLEIEVTSESVLEELTLQAERSLQTGPSILPDAHRKVLLNTSHTVGEAGVSFGTILTLQTRPTAVARTGTAFAAILGDSPVVAWGNPHFGGDSSGVRDRLKNVRQIQATSRAFATILCDGSVVIWGSALLGGNSSRTS